MSRRALRFPLLLAVALLLATLVHAQDGHNHGSSAAAPAAASTGMAGGHSGHGMGSSPTTAAAGAATTPAATSDPALPAPAEATKVSSDKITAYCQAAPKVSAPCSLWTMCRESKNAPVAVCGTAAIAKLVCDVDKANAKDLCDEYKSVCSGDKCRQIGWVGFGPSAAFQNATFDMCDAHAMMNETMVGCDQCTKPATGSPAATETDFTKLNTTCSSFDQYGMMCGAMPRMRGCSVWRTLCATLPNAASVFGKFCSAEAMAAAKVTFNSSLITAAQGGSPTTTGAGAAAAATTTTKSGGAAGLGAPIVMQVATVLMLAASAMSL